LPDSAATFAGPTAARIIFSIPAGPNLFHRTTIAAGAHLAADTIHSQPSETGKRLLEKASRFQSAWWNGDFHSRLNKRTSCVHFGEEKTALSASEFCLSNGIKVPAIRPQRPGAYGAVAFSLHADLTEENLDMC